MYQKIIIIKFQKKNKNKKNVESSKRKVTNHIQRMLNKIISRFIIRNIESNNVIGQYTQSAKTNKTKQRQKKQLSNKNPISGKISFKSKLEI